MPQMKPLFVMLIYFFILFLMMSFSGLYFSLKPVFSGVSFFTGYGNSWKW